jgi:uncharacterized flavoprotein (TIGR03862 family)
MVGDSSTDQELSPSMKQTPFDVAVVGGGPAGLMAAEVLASGGATVTVYDRMPSLARKFLLAGRGGLNLTHSEGLEQFQARYGAAAPHLRQAIEDFSPIALRSWCEGLGQETFVGSSGRVFPTAMKASPLLRAWLKRLGTAGVRVRLRHRWSGWDGDGRLLFTTDNGPVAIAADAVVLALGGASWPRLGSDGGWVGPLTDASVAVAPLRPANCGFLTRWTDVFCSRFEGEPLKRIELSFGDMKATGDAVVTATGLEGGAIYALSVPLRQAIAESGEAILHIDLRPDIAHAELENRLGRPRAKQSLSTFLRKAAHLSPVAIGLLQEAALTFSAPLKAMTPAGLAERVKAVPVRLTGTAAIDRAISTAGGIEWGELDEHLMLRRRPGTFIAGEMLDWNAPTGGYLLQASFATGARAGRGALQWCASAPP